MFESKIQKQVQAIILGRFDAVYTKTITTLPIDWSKLNLAFRDDRKKWNRGNKMSDLIYVAPLKYADHLRTVLKKKSSKDGYTHFIYPDLKSKLGSDSMQFIDPGYRSSDVTKGTENAKNVFVNLDRSCAGRDQDRLIASDKKKKSCWRGLSPNLVLPTEGSIQTTMDRLFLNGTGDRKGAGLLTRRVDLFSHNGNPNEIGVQDFSIVDCEVEAVVSKAQPRKHKNWGCNKHQLWVTGGLRATFRVSVRLKRTTVFDVNFSELFLGLQVELGDAGDFAVSQTRAATDEIQRKVMRGDVLLAVDGRDITGLTTLSSLHEHLGGIKTRPLRLTFRRSQEEASMRSGSAVGLVGRRRRKTSTGADGPSAI